MTNPTRTQEQYIFDELIESLQRLRNKTSNCRAITNASVLMNLAGGALVDLAEIAHVDAGCAFKRDVADITAHMQEPVADLFFEVEIKRQNAEDEAPYIDANKEHRLTGFELGVAS